MRSLMHIEFRDIFFQPARNDPAKGPYSPSSLRRSPRRICKELPSKSLPRASLTAVVSTEKIRPGTFPAKNRPHCYENGFITQAQPGQSTSINGALAFCVKKKYLAFLLLEKGFRSSAARLRLFQGFVRRPNIFLADCSRGMLDALWLGGVNLIEKQTPRQTVLYGQKRTVPKVSTFSMAVIPWTAFPDIAHISYTRFPSAGNRSSSI